MREYEAPWGNGHDCKPARLWAGLHPPKVTARGRLKKKLKLHLYLIFGRVGFG